MLALTIAWRQCRSLWSSGEIRVLLLALILAVTATTTVSFFTDRLHRSMQTQGNVLLGADLVVNADHVIPTTYRAEAQRLQYQTTQALEFSSMVVKDERNELAEIKAVEQGFPLRGKLTIRDAQTPQAQKITNRIPAPGTVWMEPSLATVSYTHLDVYKRQMQVRQGDSLIVNLNPEGQLILAPKATFNKAEFIKELVACLLYTSRCV